MKKTLAILGGMGPEASEYMYKTLIKMSIEKFGAVHNDQFPDIALLSVPVPDFISDENSKKTALKMLKSRVRMIDSKQVLCFSIACNTAHLLLDDLQKETKVPFVSMIGEMVKQVQKGGYKKIGLMGTPTTLRTGLYSQTLKKVGVESVLPNPKQIEQLEQIIRGVIAGKNGKREELLLIKIADSLVSKGAEAVILGCTELPLVFPAKYRVPSFNSIAVLAEALLTQYYHSLNRKEETFMFKGGDKRWQKEE